MKTKIKPLIILIAIFAATLIAGIASGCNIGEPTPKDSVDDRGMYASVTYYANGGSFSSSNLFYKTMYVVPGNPIQNIGVSESKLSISRTNYIFKGWVEAELDQNGNPILLKSSNRGRHGEFTVYDEVLPALENGTASIKGADGRELNEQQKYFTAKIKNADNPHYAFANGSPTLQNGEHLYLVATWEPDVTLDFVLISDGPVTFSLPKPEGEEAGDVAGGETGEEGGNTDKEEELVDTVIQPKNIIKSQYFGGAGYVTLNSTINPALLVSDHSFIYLYWDIDCTVPVKAGGDPVIIGEDGKVITDPEKAGEGIERSGNRVSRPQDGKPATVYAKYVSGKWTPVSTTTNVSSMFNNLGSTNYYLVNDIDCSSLTLTMRSATFNGQLKGNGFTLSNIKVGSEKSPYAPLNDATVSLFGKLGENAVIEDLTITNVTAYVKSSVPRAGAYTIYVYALFTDFEDGATLTNFNVEGYSLNLIRERENSFIGNIQFIDGAYETDHWLYGGNSDEKFISKFGNIIKDAALTIDNELIIGQEESNE